MKPEFARMLNPMTDGLAPADLAAVGRKTSTHAMGRFIIEASWLV